MVPVNELVMQFQAKWELQPMPDLRAFFAAHGLQLSDPDIASRFLPEILKVDLRNRLTRQITANDLPVVSEYVKLFGMLTLAQRSDLAAEELRLRAEPIAETQVPITTPIPVGKLKGTSVAGIQGFVDFLQIGAGALGVVHKARQLGTNRDVAIKLIRPELEMDEKARQLFIREASIASRLHHPRIVDCLSFGFAGTRPYLVMEYVESDNLEELVWKHSPARRVRLAVKVVLQILEALIYAHKLGIVHRDIKPSNVLAARSKDKLRLKVSDFGLAKMFETAGHSGITGTGELCGTLAYMSPEQLLDSRSAKPECDTYAAVVCLFRLLTGEYPYPEYSITDSYRRRLSEEARPARDFNSQIPAPLASIIQQALLRDLSKRLKSANKLHVALQPFALRSDS